MRAEELFLGLASIDDELLERSEKRVNSASWWKVASVAACFVFMLGIGMFFYKGNAPGPTTPEEGGISVQLPEGFVDVSELLPKEGEIIPSALGMTSITIGDYKAEYTEEASAGSDILKNSIGDVVDENEGWYKIAGHEDLLYLINKNEVNEYSLWKFQSFSDGEYPYKDVLEKVYHIHSAEDIVEITSDPADMDMTDEGIAIQKEIGTQKITDRNDINTIYEVISNMTCYGDNKWEMIGLDEASPEAMQNYVRVGRYLTLATSKGNKIDTLKYTGSTKRFYEYSGIAYNELSEGQAKNVEGILGILTMDE